MLLQHPLAVGARMFVDEMNDPGAVELVLGGEPRPQALLADGADARVDALELRVSEASHAWLAGHAVAGQPVVPLVLVAEWLARAVQGWRPGLKLVALHDLKVLKGIRLGHFGNGGDRLRIEGRAQPAGVRCAQLDEAKCCRIFGRSERPAVCGQLQPSADMCGTRDDGGHHAMLYLARLESLTAPQ